jgi:hypothetical protein
LLAELGLKAALFSGCPLMVMVVAMMNATAKMIGLRMAAPLAVRHFWTHFDQRLWNQPCDGDCGVRSGLAGQGRWSALTTSGYLHRLTRERPENPITVSEVLFVQQNCVGTGQIYRLAWKQMWKTTIALLQLGELQPGYSF